MANIHSQIKRIQRSERERLENRKYTSRIKTYLRRLEERVAAGKPPQAHIGLHATQLGSEVVIAVTDDGRGIDPSAVGRAASGHHAAPSIARATGASTS